MADSKLATFKIDPDVWQEFQDKAKQDKTNASALLKEFINAYLNGTLAIEPSSQVEASQLESVLERVASLEERLGKLSVA